MIEFVKGKLAIKQPHRVVIDNNGIGIEIQVPFSTSSHLPEVGKDVTILTYLHWRQEDSPQLFGFATEDERQIFKVLVGVNKVGPKLALNIMSAAEPVAFATMILSEDTAKLNSLKGVGPKLASRLVVELKDKIAKLGIGAATPLEKETENKLIPFEADVRDALENFGYTSKEISMVIKRMAHEIPDNSTIEDVISLLLQNMN